MGHNKRRNYEVDLLKTFSIIMIIICHVSQKIKGLPLIVDNINRLGQLGVQIFFVMSAYLCCVTSEKMNMAGADIKNFYLKKFLRLAPAYWFAIVFYQLLFKFVKVLNLPIRIYTDTSGINCAINFTLLNNLFPKACNSIVPGGWSISCLWIFFIIFPFVARKCNNLRQAVNIYIVSMILVLLYGVSEIFVLGNIIENNTFLYFNIIPQLPCFITGILLFFYEREAITLKRQELIIKIVISLGITLLVFFAEKSETIIWVPLFSSLTIMFVYLYLKNFCKLKENNYIIHLSKMTLSVFVFHPLFAYYGVGYINKILEYFCIYIPSLLLYAFSVIMVLVFSYILSIKMDRVFSMPLKLYRDIKN